MDKNLLRTVVFAAVIIIAFTWLNKPGEEQMRRERERQEEIARQEAEKASQGEATLTIDSVSPSELSEIRATVRQYGIADSATHVMTLRAPHATITVSGDGAIGGTVNAAGAAVPVTDLLKLDFDAVPRDLMAQAMKTLRADLATVGRYQGFARFLSGDSATVRLANKDLTLELSNKGGRIARATLNNYDCYAPGADSSKVELIAPGRDSYSFTLTSATRRFETSEFYFTPVVESDSTVLMQLDLGGGAMLGLRYTLPSEGYLVDVELVQQGMSSVIPPSTASIDMQWRSTLERTEAGRVLEERNSALYWQLAGGDVDNLDESGDDKKEVQTRVKWVGFKNQFFSAVLVSRANFTSAHLQSAELKDNPSFIKTMQADMTMEYSSAQAVPAAFTLFLGPNSYPLLKDLEQSVSPGDDLRLTKLIPLGWSLFRWINTLIVIPVFDFLGRYIADYGIIILILTVFIKILLFPFTWKSYMSQAKMRLLQPEIKQINDKWPGQENALKRQQETMALYSRAGASPFSGCLPMLLQMPVLIAIFQFFPSAIELRGESFLWVKNLAAPDAIVSWTANIPFISGTFGNHISLFCLLMTITNIVYMRINMQSQPMAGEGMAGMKWLNYLMPVMFLFFFNNYAAGLSYYYFISLLITIVQTYAFRHLINEDKMRAKMAANAKKPRKKSGFMARLEEAQRQQQAALRQQQQQRKR